jgi:YfiH family protein
MQEVQSIQSALLSRYGINHGWFTRYGGVSEGAFSTLNGKKGNGDVDENVDENRRRAVATLGRKPEDLAHIIHSFQTNILEAVEPGEFTGYDASLTVSDNRVLSQTTADCGTVIIAAKDGSVVSLVHGSWHTLKEKIICETVAKLKTHTSAELVAGIGPMICQKCYEFGPEARTLFNQKYLQKTGENYLVDLKTMIVDQLHESGITEIDDSKVCTKEDERFFSHRQSVVDGGRFLTLVCK